MAQGLWQGIERRTREAAELADRVERAGALLALLKHADEGWTWDEDWKAGWNRRVDAFAIVNDALVGAGPAVVDAILAGDAPPGTWYAGAAAMALDELHAGGAATGREEEVLEWLLRNSRDQVGAFSDATALVVGRMGAASVPALERFARRAEDDFDAVATVHELLEGADPAWAAPAAEGMLRRLAEGGAGLTLTIGVAAALYGLLGPAAASAVREALPLAAGVAGDGEGALMARVVGAVDSLLALRDDGEGPTGPDWWDVDDDIEAWQACFGPDAGPLPCSGGEGDCPEDCPISEPFLAPGDIAAVPRFLLERACKGLGLDAGGPKAELVRRLWEHHERMLGLLVDPVPREEIEAMPTRELRELCEGLGLEEGGRKTELVERLDRFYRGEDVPEAPVETFSRRELDAMTAAQLRTVCEDMDLDEGGNKAAMVARVLAAQGERLR